MHFGGREAKEQEEMRVAACVAAKKHHSSDYQRLIPVIPCKHCGHM